MLFACLTGETSGDTASSSEQTKPTLHAFPLHDQQLTKEWLKAIHREDFVPTDKSRLCSLHFYPSDFVCESKDSNSRRKRQRLSSTLSRRYLLPTAVPRRLPNAPAYLSSMPPVERNTHATAQGRRGLEEQQLNELVQAFEEEEDISSKSLDDLRHRLLTDNTVPHGYEYCLRDSSLLVMYIELKECVPVIRCCISIDATDKRAVVSIDGKTVPKSQLADLFSDNMQTYSQLLNTMARCKSWCCDKKPSAFLLSMAVDCLQQYVLTIDDLSDDRRQLTFLLEQLNLLGTNKYGRHYSPELILWAYLIYSASSAAYRVIIEQGALCVPSIRTLKKITKRMDKSSGLDNTSYLKLRVKKLNEYERNVLLMIDEIYVAKRLEYSGGKIIGMTSDGKPASTLLCFMVKSVAGDYKDIIGIYPISNLTAAKQFACYTDVSALLSSVNLNVVAISVDNAAVNRKFFIDHLCGGTLKTHIRDSATGQPIYLLFDPVHDMKNVYNNFQHRKLFECPAMSPILAESCKADFSHINALYELEAAKPLKKAYKLTPAVLNPKSIEKTSVKLATAVFDETTQHALEYYAQHDVKPEWSGTARFIALIIKAWNVLNVKSCTKGFHKRQLSMDPIRSALDWKITYLQDVSQYFATWEASGRAGLSKETFLALRHTCFALAECAVFLIQQKGFNYVLLGQLQSDDIESRFGWLRQLSGANYFISMKQVMEGDQKIRAISLLKFSQVTLSEIDDQINFEAIAAGDDACRLIAEKVVSLLHLTAEVSESDANTVYFVSGFAARSTVRQTHCDSCQEALVCTDDAEVAQTEYSTFLNDVNRGGLTKPTMFVFTLSLLCWRVWEELKQTEAALQPFLSHSNHRKLFTAIMDCVLYTEEFSSLLFGCSLCSQGHDMSRHIICRMFNAFIKNYVKEVCAAADEQKKMNRARKAAKLSSV